MEKKRIILEMGTGNDLYGGDYTKAAKRAVQDALHHSSITLFKSIGMDHTEMTVQVTIAVARPDKVDCAAVAAELPRGIANVRAVKGGLDVEDAATGTCHIIATAAIEAFVPDQKGKWKLSEV
jgi:uncharacterized protein (TIGR02058 family)